jgi:S1-C subfamily serine protease
MSEMNLEGSRPVNAEGQEGYVLTPPPPAPTYTQQVPNPNYARRLTAAIIAAIVLATGGGIGIGWSAARLLTNHTTATAHVQTVSPAAPNTRNGSLSAAAIAAKVNPAIVDINTEVLTTNGTSAAAGTGLILTSTGDILTNNHVVEGSVSIKVAIQGRSGTYNATVIGVDPGADLAVIHIDNISGLPTVTMADSSTVSVGDKVYAMGNALGLGGTPKMTQGSVTALNQTITASENGVNSETLTGMIQADAEISPGDSGGALVNTAGQVVGIITAGEAQGFRSTTSTVNYAIPSSAAVTIANKILARQAGDGIIIGSVGYLGVSVETLDSTTANQLGLSISSGALVRGVQAGSPAQGAGITAGSVITAVNTTTIDSATALGNALHAFKPGDRVKITWYSGGAFHSATVTLITGPNV